MQMVKRLSPHLDTVVTELRQPGHQVGLGHHPVLLETETDLRWNLRWVFAHSAFLRSDESICTAGHELADA